MYVNESSTKCPLAQPILLYTMWENCAQFWVLASLNGKFALGWGEIGDNCWKELQKVDEEGALGAGRGHLGSLEKVMKRGKNKVKGYLIDGFHMPSTKLKLLKGM